jgi:protein tyrosine/serine phosphatase
MFLIVAAFLSNQAIAKTKERPTNWATPVKVEGVPNLHKVSNQLYRSAQPTKEGMRNLEKIGIKTIVNLRSLHSDRDELEGTKLNYEHIVFNPINTEKEDLVRFIKIMNDPSKHPVLVHCKHGADRTGTMAAFYRIIFQGWSKEEAILEMKNGGYGFHKIFKNMIELIQETNIEEVKKEAGIK